MMIWYDVRIIFEVDTSNSNELDFHQACAAMTDQFFISSGRS